MLLSNWKRLPEPPAQHVRIGVIQHVQREACFRPPAEQLCYSAPRDRDRLPAVQEPLDAVPDQPAEVAVSRAPEAAIHISREPHQATRAWCGSREMWIAA